MICDRSVLRGARRQRQARLRGCHKKCTVVAKTYSGHGTQLPPDDSATSPELLTRNSRCIRIIERLGDSCRPRSIPTRQVLVARHARNLLHYHYVTSIIGPNSSPSEA
jgi:hypothetical protein